MKQTYEQLEIQTQRNLLLDFINKKIDVDTYRRISRHISALYNYLEHKEELTG